MRKSLPALALALFVFGAMSPTSMASPAAATVAGQIAVKETAQLHQVARHGSQHQERGSGTGTFGGSVAVTFTTTGFTQASVSFAIKTSGGSIYGAGKPSYRIAGTTAYFNGSLRITGGTGRYRHISRSSLTLRGTLNRHNFALAISVTGKLTI